MTLEAQLQHDLIASMKAQDQEKTSALRMIKAALEKRFIEKQAPLDDGDVMKILTMLAKQRREAADQFTLHHRPDLALKEHRELDLIMSYLPPTASAEELRQAVEEALTETGASSPKEMGAVMKVVMAKLVGKSVDGKAASELVRSRLSA